MKADPVRGTCGTHGGYETAEVRHVRRTGGGRGLRGGQGKEWMGCLLNDLRFFGINADQWTTAAYSTRGNGTRRRIKERNVSWRSGSLQRKPRLDYGM